MYRLFKLCQLCLCRDKKMFLLRELKIMLLELNLWETKYIDGYVCWECKVTMQKFFKFKENIRKAQFLLLQGETRDLKDLSSLSCCVAVQISIDPVLNTLSECDGMSINTKSNSKAGSSKQEILSEDKATILKCLSENVIEVTIEPIEPKKNFNKNPLLKHEFINSDLTVKLEVDSAHEETTGASKPTHVKKSYTSSIENFLEVDDITIGDQTDNVDDKIISIEITEEELNKKRQLIKDDPNFKNCVHKCETCLIGFKMYKSLQIHMSKSHYYTPSHLLCRICDSQFLKAKDLASHRKQHYINYKCKDCGSEFRDKMNALFHYSIRHKDQLPQQRRRQFIEVKSANKEFEEVAKQMKKEFNKKRRQKRKSIAKSAKTLFQNEGFADVIKKEKDQVTLVSTIPVGLREHWKKIKLETEVHREQK